MDIFPEEIIPRNCLKRSHKIPVSYLHNVAIVEDPKAMLPESVIFWHPYLYPLEKVSMRMVTTTRAICWRLTT
ncbi:7340_t:CDS:2 [Rhizophagus irregularis]|nr:7340_t:CDS:2 [Rhizophagus irregularis]